MATTASLDARLPGLRDQVREIQDHYPKLSDDDSFTAWFLRAYLVDTEHDAAAAVTGVSRDKGIDAVWIDDRAHRVFVVQAKYRQKLLATSEGRGDVLGFAGTAQTLLGDERSFADFLTEIDPLVGDRAKDARERCTKRGYKLDLYYVTTGKCSAALVKEARSKARQGSKGQAALTVLDGARIVAILDDYLDGVAPPVPSIDLPIEAGGSGIVHRYDDTSGIESWVFTANGGNVAALFEQAGIRIFARNVRGFLGLSTAVNRAMTKTLEERPGFFLYFNNGVTIVCDDADKYESKGSSILQIANPQIINGQQTTRTLHASDKLADGASVLVRVIRIPRGQDGTSGHFDALISQIVEATNWQNQIRASDLMANDRQQILIERELRKLGYQYLRKRQTKGEARRAAGSQFQFIIKKDEFAQAVAGCELDPAVVREGKERLFEDRYHTVFPSGDPDYYLTRYWLMRWVSQNARGNPERTYARWVVLHFVWNDLQKDFKKLARAFRAMSENRKTQPEAARQLDAAIERVVLAAVKFYKTERRTESTVLDPTAFFSRQGRAKQFSAFWISTANPHRVAFEKARAAFVEALANG